jgi:hypothetical protein
VTGHVLGLIGLTRPKSSSGFLLLSSPSAVDAIPVFPIEIGDGKRSCVETSVLILHTF